MGRGTVSETTTDATDATDTTAPEALLAKPDVAAWLGVSVKTIDTWVRMREIPFVRVGRLVRFERAVIEDWITTRRRGPR